MAQWVTVKVFVSSTFQDMQAERDYLVKRVFPQLQEWCDGIQIRLVDVDLRWGVTEEDVKKNRDAVRVCLRGVDRCRPFFVCFLGQRRGSIAAREDVAAGTLDDFPGIDAALGNASMTELEILHSLSAPQQSVFFYVRDPSYLDELPPEVRREYTNPDEGADAAMDAWRQQHVVDSGRPVRVYRAHAGRDHRLGGFRLADGGLPLADVILEDLKAAIRHRLSDTPRRFSSVARRIPADELELELAAQEQFLYEHNDGFIERSGDFDAMDGYLRDHDRRIFLLIGASGAGKSSLLARWIDRIGPERVQYRFIGAGDSSASPATLLRSLARQLFASPRRRHEAIPDDPDQLRMAWPSLLAEAGREKPLILVLDALNQLSGGISELSWLPAALPANVHVIASAIEPWREEGLRVHAIRAFDDASDRRRLADAYLTRHLKRMDAPALEALISTPGTENPLFLKIVLSELRLVGSPADVARRTRDGFGSSPASAFDALLSRLEADPPYTPLNPERAVPLLFGLLSCARGGLHREELVDLIGHHYPHDVQQDVRDTVSVCLRQVRAFLARRSMRNDFFHESFRSAAAERYSGREPWHEMLADHFRRRAGTAPPAKKLFDVHVSGDIEALLQARYMESMVAILDGRSFDPITIVTELHDMLNRILHADADTELGYLEQLRSQGSCVFPALPEESATLAMETLTAYGLEVSVEPATPAPPGPWPSERPRDFEELLHHQVRAERWQDLVDVLTDDAFVLRCRKLLGARAYVQAFRELSAGARPFLNQMRLRMPVDQYTLPLLRELVAEFEESPDEALRFTALCARAPKQHERAVIGIRPLLKAAKEFRLPADAHPVLRDAILRLLSSPKKTARWEALHAYWALVPDGTPEPLLKIASSEQEHALVRAEAARQLGYASDPSLLPTLRGLTSSSQYPVRMMARRSARMIEMNAGLISPGPIDDWKQPEKLPESLGPLLRELDINSSVIDLTDWARRPAVLIHVVACSDLSMETQWREMEIVETILRRLPCHLICCEGGWGDCSLTPMKQLASTETWSRVAPVFFHDFMINAEEYLQLVTDLSFSLQGIDEPATYQKMLDAKLRGNRGTDLVASTVRAQRMLDQTLAHVRAANPPVGILITSDLPAYLIATMLGQQTQFDPHGAMDRLLPERVPARLIRKEPDLVYVVVRVPQATGDIFGMDVNYIHALSATTVASRESDNRVERMSREVPRADARPT